jgi:hypothetical protein
MKLYTFYKCENKVVYGTVVNGKSVFFFSGFSSADEAKEATMKAHLEYKKADRPKAPVGMLQAELEMVFSGEWSEIE